MIGKHSIKKTFLIHRGAEIVKFVIQTNKNGGICDMVPKVNHILSDFQNCQLDSETVQESLINALTEYANEEA